MSTLKRLWPLFLLMLWICAAASGEGIPFSGGILPGDDAKAIESKTDWTRVTGENIPDTLIFRGEFAGIPETTAVYYLGSGGRLTEAVFHLCGDQADGAVPGSLDEDTADLCFRLARAALEQLYGAPEKTGKGRLDPPGNSGVGLCLCVHDQYDQAIAVAKELAASGFGNKKKIPEFTYLGYAVWNVSSAEGNVNIQLETVSEKDTAGYVSYGTNLYFSFN